MPLTSIALLTDTEMLEAFAVLVLAVGVAGVAILYLFAKGKI